MSKLAQMTLLFLSVDRKPDLAGLIEGKTAAPDDYYIVRKLPLIEMLSKDPGNILEELIAMTASDEWQTQFRRPMNAGDILCFGNEPWLLIRTDDAIKLKANVVRLPAHTDFGLILLSQEQFKDLTCKPITLTT